MWDETAIDQLRDARLHGDDRAPPIVHDPVPAERPSASELAYPELYQEYETRQEVKLKAAFIDAAYPEIQKIESQLQQMRAAGLDQAALREAEEKLIQLQAMTQNLQEQHPELAPESDSNSVIQP